MESASHHRALRLELSEVSVASAYPLTIREKGHEFIFPHFHSTPDCKEKGLIQPHDSGAPFSRIDSNITAEFVEDAS
jgi:hypothetical protein